jgi:hypothetical protein
MEELDGELLIKKTQETKKSKKKLLFRSISLYLEAQKMEPSIQRLEFFIHCTAKRKKTEMRRSTQRYNTNNKE